MYFIIFNQMTIKAYNISDDDNSEIGRIEIELADYLN